jgi:hypothetical protein
LGLLFPIYGKIKAMFQTTNQYPYIYIYVSISIDNPSKCYPPVFRQTIGKNAPNYQPASIVLAFIG